MFGLMEQLSGYDSYTATVVSSRPSLMFSIPAPLMMDALEVSVPLLRLALQDLVHPGRAGHEPHRIPGAAPSAGQPGHLSAPQLAGTPGSSPTTIRITRREMAEQLHIHLRSLYRYLDDLKMDGLCSWCTGTSPSPGSRPICCGLLPGTVIKKGGRVCHEDSLRGLAEHRQGVSGAPFCTGRNTRSSVGFAQAAGGKGLNQTVALARAGAEVRHAGAVGADGGLLRQTLRQAGVDDSLLAESSLSTGHAIIQVDPKGQNSIIVTAGANGALERDYLSAMLNGCEAGDILLLQNETNELPWLLQEGRRRGLTVAFNPSPITPELLDYPLDCVDILILNEIEGAALSGENDPARIPAALRARYPRARVMLTLGGDGCVYEDDTQTVRQGIFPVTAVDTTAAGDTFCGYFLAWLAQGEPVAQALRAASAAAALAVSRPGAAPSIPQREEVLDFLRSH